MRHVERVVPGTSFVEARHGLEVLALAGIEGREEAPVLLQRPQAAVLGVPVVLVSQGALTELGGVFRMAQGIGKAGQGRIGHVIFEGVGNGVVAGEILREPAQRDVAALDVRVGIRTHPVLRPRRIGGLEERLVGGLDVKVRQSFEIGVRQHRDHRVAFHREGLPAIEFPLGHPAPFAVHAHDRTRHVDLLLGVEEGQELVQVPAGVPEGEHRVAVLAFRYTAHAPGAHPELRLAVASGRDLVAVHGGGVAELHQRIFAVHVLQDVRMDERMVEGGVEDGLLLFGAAGNADAPQLLLPGLFRRIADGREVKAGLLRIQILPRIVDAHEGNAHLDQDLFSLGEVLVAEPVADIVPGKLPGIGLVQFVPAGIAVPGRLGRHRPLLLPVAAPFRGLAHAKDEVHREHGVPVVAERAHEFGSLDLRVGNPPEGRAGFVGQAFAQVHQDVAGTAGEGIAFQ